MICVFVDRFSKMTHFVPTTTRITAQGMARLYLDNVFRLHGIPSKIIHDRGVQFDAAFMKEFYRLLRIEGNPSTAYHPQTDGQTERMNQELEQFLRLYVNHRQDDWASTTLLRNSSLEVTTTPRANHSGLMNTTSSLSCSPQS